MKPNECIHEMYKMQQKLDGIIIANLKPIHINELGLYQRWSVAFLVKLSELIDELGSFKFWDFHSNSSAKDIVREKFVDCISYLISMDIKLQVHNHTSIIEFKSRKLMNYKKTDSSAIAYYLKASKCAYDFYEKPSTQQTKELWKQMTELSNCCGLFEDNFDLHRCFEARTSIELNKQMTIYNRKFKKSTTKIQEETRC